MSTKTYSHTSASTQVAQTSAKAEVITISNAAGGSPVWVSTNPQVLTQPWYGIQVAPGTSQTFSGLPGMITYTYAPYGPASLTITTT